MEQHPVPQHISSYEFKLVGDMTLKQFFQLAGGILVALIFYATPLPGIIKWPLIMFFALIGAALAFMPLRERPLSTWFFAFIRAIYAPTIYTFAAGGSEEVFQKDSTSPETEIVMPQGPQRAKEYLADIPKTTIEEKFDQSEETFFQRVTSLFHSNVQSAAIPTQQITPTSTPPITPVQPSSQQDTGQQVIAITPQTIGRSASVYMQVVEEPEEDVHGNPAKNIQPIGAPVSQQIQVEHQKPNQSYFTTPPTTVSAFQDIRPTTQPLQTTITATFMPEATPPEPPDRPNTIVGQVLAQNGKIIDGAILEIRDSSGKPVRAIRTNKVGHFITVTPISNGDYELETEKDDLKFDVVKFRAEGEIIPPIMIRAKE